MTSAAVIIKLVLGAASLIAGLGLISLTLRRHPQAARYKSHRKRSVNTGS